ncbi:hypothetical protein MKZ38_008173 [Zalerion maritima]|uniref:Uncharacterized protein n=1 Tax=Zalerion maritima TaxID=339359 RepID=A0AAD5RVI6_9PEZI|nr:hypothetical protein MKZ38_008173 [Zalerion maritima]
MRPFASLVQGGLATLVVLTLPSLVISADASSMSTSLLYYYDEPYLATLPTQTWHLGPGKVSFITDDSDSTTELDLGWKVGPVKVQNQIIIPMDIAGLGGGVYYKLSSISLSGNLDLGANGKFDGIKINILSDLASGSVAGGALSQLANPTVEPTSGDFSVTYDISPDSTASEAEKKQLCEGGVDSWEMTLQLFASASGGAVLDGMDGTPLMLSLEAEWFDC